jgi:hypothetical protein
MLVTFDFPAPAGERFAPDAFTRAVGNAAGFSPGDDLTLPGILHAAEVKPGGLSAELTVDVPDNCQPSMALLCLAEALTEGLAVANPA